MHRRRSYFKLLDFFFWFFVSTMQIVRYVMIDRDHIIKSLILKIEVFITYQLKKIKLRCLSMNYALFKLYTIRVIIFNCHISCAKIVVLRFIRFNLYDIIWLGVRKKKRPPFFFLSSLLTIYFSKDWKSI